MIVIKKPKNNFILIHLYLNIHNNIFYENYMFVRAPYISANFLNF